MKIAIAFLRLLSHLPLRVLYALADICYPVIYYVMGYRRKVVRKNIDRSFPERSMSERRQIEKRFYRWFCDYVVETIKLLSISPEEMKRRMIVEGMEEMERELETHPFVFIYLGHYCNWEWISSMPLWSTRETTHCAQLYRPLKSKAFDSFFYQMRTRFGADNISKYESMRHILQLKQKGERTIIGFIADQAPGWNSIHDWVDFLHQDTPVFTGTERIAKKVDAAVFFADVKRERRGQYRLRLRLMTDHVKDIPNYELTERYMAELEKIIQRQPHLWLWSHRRWKRQRHADGTFYEEPKE